MIKMGFELIAHAQPFHMGASIGFHLLEHRGTEPRQIATAVVCEPFDEGTYREPFPLFELHGDRAQRLIDQLWDCGLRPTQGKQSEGVTAAQSRHLEDMRTLTFAKLGIEKP